MRTHDALRIERASEVPDGALGEALEVAVAEVCDQVRRRAHGARVMIASAAPAPSASGGIARAFVRAWYVCPTSKIWGLPGWRATLDGSLTTRRGVRVAWSAHEVAKGVRMLTRQSLEAIELSAGVWLPLPASSAPYSGPWAEALGALLGGGLHRGAGATLLASARALVERPDPGAHAGAMRLARAVDSMAQTGTLRLEGWPEAEAPSVAAARAAIDAAAASWTAAALPTRPPGYDALSAWLVRLRAASLRLDVAT